MQVVAPAGAGLISRIEERNRFTALVAASGHWRSRREMVLCPRCRHSPLENAARCTNGRNAKAASQREPARLMSPSGRSLPDHHHQRATSGHTPKLRNIINLLSVTSGLTSTIRGTVALGLNPEVTHDKNRLRPR